MPGYKIPHAQSILSKYQCPYCKLLLKKAVQLRCGDWLCQECADELLVAESSLVPPQCPRAGCEEFLEEDEEDGLRYFPDRFVRREIEETTVGCPHQKKGCQWVNKVAMLEYHLQTCNYITEECEQCGQTLTLKSHHVCPKAKVKRPVVSFHTILKLGEDLKDVEKLSSLIREIETFLQDLKERETFYDFQKYDPWSEMDDASPFASLIQDAHSHTKSFASHQGYIDEKVGARKLVDDELLDKSAQRKVADETDRNISEKIQQLRKLNKELKTKLEAQLSAHLQRTSQAISDLKITIAKLEKSMQSKHAEFGDRDFRLSLIENSNHDGSMIWRIPQFSKRMTDAQTGRYTSIFSLPFYTGRYGYKMCLKLYIQGDGFGKNTHMSFFFVVMKGEFDNILQWPFTHKVTFKLVNQNGGRDIIDTFQPDSMSSSFRKPKSDMNIASGCPRFASHTELKSDGFIVEDTVFIECIVDVP